MPRTSEFIKNLELDESKRYDIRVNQVKIKNCKLVQQTDWLFVFEEMFKPENKYKKKLCIQKVEYYLNNIVINCVG